MLARDAETASDTRQHPGDALMGVAPSPWPVASLGELCRIELGSTPPRKVSGMWDTDKRSDNVWLTIADLPTSLHATVVDSKEYVSDIAATNMRLIPSGTLLVSFKLTLGRLSLMRELTFIPTRLSPPCSISTRTRVRQRFLYWALSAFDWDKAAAGDQKIKGKTLNKAKLKRLPVPLAPLDEQRRIVTVLDEAIKGLGPRPCPRPSRTYTMLNHFLALIVELRELFRVGQRKMGNHFADGSRGIGGIAEKTRSALVRQRRPAGALRLSDQSRGHTHFRSSTRATSRGQDGSGHH